jgi:hypothetical protein
MTAKNSCAMYMFPNLLQFKLTFLQYVFRIMVVLKLVFFSVGIESASLHICRLWIRFTA